MEKKPKFNKGDALQVYLLWYGILKDWVEKVNAIVNNVKWGSYVEMGNKHTFDTYIYEVSFLMPGITSTNEISERELLFITNEENFKYYLNNNMYKDNTKL